MARYDNARQATKAIYKAYGIRKAGTAVWSNGVLALFRKAKDIDTTEGREIAEYHKAQGETLTDVLIIAGRKVYSFAEGRTFNLATALRS